MSTADTSDGVATPTQHPTGRRRVITGVAIVVALAIIGVGIGIWRNQDSGGSSTPSAVRNAAPRLNPAGTNATPALGGPQPLSFVIHWHGYSREFSVTPIWDSFNNCILDNPFPDSFHGRLGKDESKKINATKNFGGQCAVEKSQMHWRVAFGGFAEEVRVAGAFNNATCIDLEGRAHYNVSCSYTGDVDITPRG